MRGITMKRPTRFALLLTLLILPLAAVASGDHEDDSLLSVQGEVLDMACYLAHDAKGDDHAGCAKMCAKSGQPMGLLTSDGTVYLLYAGHDDSSAYDETKEFAGTTVVIKGKPTAAAGIQGLEVRSVKKI
jgi:hypothetical protein